MDTIVENHYTGEDDWWRYPSTVEAVSRWWATQDDCTPPALVGLLFGDPEDYTEIYLRWLHS